MHFEGSCVSKTEHSIPLGSERFVNGLYLLKYCQCFNEIRVYSKG